MTTATLQTGLTYRTRDGKSVSPERIVTGNFHDRTTGRYFTPTGGCIAYYRGNDPIIEHDRSIDEKTIVETNNYDGPPENDNPGEPPITNAERISSGKVKPR